MIADRYGRTRALMASVLIYSVFTAACGLAQTVAQLAVFRILLGIGMGGEWASGAALVSETWADRASRQGARPDAERVGDWLRAAALVTMIVLPRWGWRAVFFVGILPAFFTLWVRRRVSKSRRSGARRARAPARDRGRAPISSAAALLRLTIPLTIMNAFTLFGWWGFNLWLPGYLSLPAAQGGMGSRRRRCRGSSSRCRSGCGSAT